MIEAARNSKPPIDSGLVPRRHARHAAGLHEGDELITPGVEEDVADLPAFLDRDGVAAHRFEFQDALVEVASLVEIVSGQANVREPFVGHVFSFRLPARFPANTSRSSPGLLVLLASRGVIAVNRVRPRTRAAHRGYPVVSRVHLNDPCLVETRRRVTETARPSAAR